MVILDSNILIDHLRRINSPEGSIFERITTNLGLKNLAISIITVQELYIGQSTKNKEIEKTIEEILSKLTIVPYNLEIAKRAGQIERDLKEKIGLGDSIIAASALLKKYKLLTLNIKHFKKVPGLELETI